MRKLLMAICLFTAVMANAQGISDSVKFGARHDVALKGMESMFGKPSNNTPNQVIFTNKDFEGFHWDEILFNFKNNKLIEARFFMGQKTKHSAKKAMYTISKMMAKKHAMTEDLEEDGTSFFKGGKSPEYFGHLFTIFISPRDGSWTTQLRFGPFKNI